MRVNYRSLHDYSLISLPPATIPYFNVGMLATRTMPKNPQYRLKI